MAERQLRPQTARSYRAAWLAWEAFADTYGLELLPAKPEDVAAFAGWLQRHCGLSPRSIEVRIAGLAWYQAAAGYGYGLGSHPVVVEARRRIRRDDDSLPAQIDGLTAEHIGAIEATAFKPRPRGESYEAKSFAERRGVLDVALCRVLRDGMLRPSEAAALRWTDVRHGARDGSGWLHVLISFDSIDVHGRDADEEAVRLWLSPPTMRALDRLKQVDPPTGPDAKVFGGRNDRTLRRRVVMAAKAAGLEGRFSGNSGRVGMARDLVDAGIELGAVMEVGRWSQPPVALARATREHGERGPVADYYRLTGELPANEPLPSDD